MIRGGVVRIRWSALESSGTIGVRFSAIQKMRKADNQVKRKMLP